MIGIQTDSSLNKLIIRGTFTNLLEDDHGNIWIGTQKDKKIAFYSDKGTALLDCPHRRIQLQEVSNTALTYSVGDVLFEVDIEWTDTTPVLSDPIEIGPSLKAQAPIYSIKGYQVTDHFVDHEKNHWYSTLGHGVIMKPRSEILQIDKSSGLLFDHVYSLTPNSDGKILVGYQNGRLQSWSDDDTSSIKIGVHSYNRLRYLELDKYLWVAADKGLLALDLQTYRTVYEYPGAVKCIQIYRDSLYFGTATGAFVINKDTPDVARSIFNKRTISLAVLSYNSILLGTNDGLNRYNGKEVLKFKARSNLNMLNGRVKSMVQIHDSIILYATAEGLVYETPNTTETWTSDGMGLSSDVCLLLKKQNDTTIWLGTNNGLDRIVLKPNSDLPSIDNFDIDDGLLSNYINDIAFSKSGIYVATDAGISILPHIVNRKHIAPKGYIIGVTVNDHDTVLQNHYNLEHFQNKIRINFSSIAFANGKNTKYLYRLKGLSKDWSNTSLDELQFEALRPGNYTFQLVALAMDGSSVSKPTTVSFKIAKPFYEEWWFILSVLFLILSGVAIVARFVIKYMSRRGLEQKNRLLEEKNEIIEYEKKRSEDLLLNILPETTAHELKEFGKVKARQHSAATVLFSDFKGFTEIAANMNAEELVAELDFCFRAYDEIMEKYNLEKIKTIGDAYMCAAGLNPDTSDDPKDMVDAALDIMKFMEQYQEQRIKNNEPYFQVRIGIHFGGVVSGVVGHKKFAFDIWGDTVNTAARLESSGVEGRINISEATYEAVKSDFECTPRGEVKAKGKGSLKMYFVEKRKTGMEPASLTNV
jgi:class 3 adenylate cyclase/ligand-binding sensor domain-containing protein